MTNLLTNAIKYSPKGKKITVHCSVNSSEATVSVTDQGFGISKDDAEHIFDRYYRVENEQTRQISGLVSVFI